MLWYGINSAKQSVEASNWPSVTGTITNLYLDKSRSPNGQVYHVEVDYHYTVMGRTYTSSRLAFGYSSSNVIQAHEDILNKLEHASSVKVRYNPQNPATSTLSCGIHTSIKFWIVFPIMFLAMFSSVFFEFWIAPPLAVFGCPLILWIVFQPDHVLLKNLEVT